MVVMLIIGHRGAKGLAFENTLKSFSIALNYADMIEFDVYKTKDDHFVVFHDYFLDRLTNASGFIEDYTLSDLEKITQNDGSKILTLNEVLDFLAPKIPINIELKSKAGKKLVKFLKEFSGDFLISSFFHEELKYFKNYKTGFLLASIPYKYDLPKELYSVHLSIEFLDKNYIDYIKNMGKKVFVYTVNKGYEFDKVKKLKVDGIFTDYPDKFKFQN